MAYDTNKIKRDMDDNPIAQYFNPDTNSYEPLEGANGASRHTLYGPDGQPITTTGNKLDIRASEIEALLNTINDNVELAGSNMDLRGTAATKPLATAVTIGATYWSVDTDPSAEAIEVSDGTKWVVM